MKTVRDAVKLQPNALEIKLSEQVEQLDQVINTEGDGSAFYQKTYITQGMRDLIVEGMARLTGSSSQAIFHLKQAMGGGKTHLLVGFGLAAKNPSLLAKYFPEHSNLNGAEPARIAAFNGRNYPDWYFWGEIANQLGKGELFKRYWTSGPDAPDEQAWLELFEGGTPLLILLDEMPPYFHNYNARPIGNGTVADIVTSAFANLLSAAGKKTNVCVVVSDLDAAYEQGSNLINKALENIKREVGRSVRAITPVDLAANEIYDILKKRLFTELPSAEDIREIANNFGQKLSEAARANTVSRGAEALAEEVYTTYPFHPRLKNIIALFKENENFKQTRGLIELVSRLLRSVWNKTDNDVYLIGPQHFDLSDTLVRDKITEISGMRDVIARDLWDAQNSAHAQVIDSITRKDSATQIGNLIMTSSLSTAVNAIKGLSKEEMIECLITPHRNASEFITAFEELEKTAWYLHHTQDERYYFDTQENLTKYLQSLAKGAPENQIEDLIRNRLTEVFKPSRKTVYEEVLPLPKIDEIAEKMRRNRVLLIVNPDSKIPPEEVSRFFEGVAQKNNICVLTGDKTAMGSVEKSARQFFASKKADHRIILGHPQRKELENKQASYDLEFTATVLNIFDKVIFPRQRAGQAPDLVHKPLDMSRDMTKPFNGEEQIEKTLTSDPKKLYLEIGQNFQAILDKAQDLLWPQNQDEVRWSDAEESYREKAGMYWLPPRGLELLKAQAISQGLWEDLNNSYVTKKPKKKKTSIQIVPEGDQLEDGSFRLKINPVNAGPAPIVYYAEDGVVSTSSNKLRDSYLTTKALKVQFLAVDPTEKFESGEPETWENTLKIRSKLSVHAKGRTVELFVVPSGLIKYSLDATEARNGSVYNGPVEIGDQSVTMLVFAEAGGIEVKQPFAFSAKGEKGFVIDDVKPAQLHSRLPKKIDSTSKTFSALNMAKEKGIIFEGVHITIGHGNKVGGIMIGEIPVEGEYLEVMLTKLQEKFSPDVPITMTFKEAKFNSGHDLKAFIRNIGIEVSEGEVEQ